MTLGLAITLIVCLLLGGGALYAAVDAWRSITGRDMYGDVVGGLLSGGFSLFLVACLLGTTAVYRHFSGPTFELMKSEWRCSRSHVVHDDEDGDYSVCDQYSRI